MDVRVIGLTGGIASGKSTVASMLIERGAGLVDADQVAREIVAVGSEGARAIREAFGDEVFQEDGHLDRAALGAIIFRDPDARSRLNQITHPRIAIRSQEALRTLYQSGQRPVVYDAPLIVENQLHKAMAGLIVVSLAEDTQLVRLMRRDGIDREAALARISAQLPLAEKTSVADWVIDNSGSRNDTAQQVDALWHELIERSQ